MKRYINLLLTIIIALSMQAQRIRVAAPKHVAVGEEFLIEYTIFSDGVQNFRLGNLPNGVERLSGPYTSSQSSIQIVNGHTSSSSSTSFTYILVANKKGTFTLPPAKIIVNGNNLASTPVRLSASGNSNTSRASSAGGNNYVDEEENSSSVSGRHGGKDLFMTVTASKTRVHEQEPILLTYKVYTAVNLSNLEGKMPDLTGFHVQEIKQPQPVSFHRETVRGRRYNCTIWQQYVLYPQMTGTLKIPALTFRGTVRQGEDANDPFAFLVDGGPREVTRELKTNGLTIQVSPLPEKPKGFSGGVGRFNISAQLSKTEIKEGDPLNIRVVIGGVGNLKLLKQPELNLSKDFEVYDPKITDKTRLTSNGVEGNIVYDYLVVPRKRGNYTIPAISFIYYDTSSNSYKTIHSQALSVRVEKGDGSNSDEEDYNTLQNEDIRGLKLGNVVTNDTENVFFGTPLYWGLFLFLLIMFVYLLYSFRRRAVAYSDVASLMGKNASKVATRRLHKASELMLKGNAEDFYDEVLHALWGYAGSKLGMPVESLSRDNISERFDSLGIDASTKDKFVGALDECEYERYAPGDEKGNMNKTFNAAKSAIMDIEEVLNPKRGKGASKAKLLLFFAVLSGSIYSYSAYAVTKDTADKEYSKGNYAKAIKDYTTLLEKEQSAELYYNLGNAYYRTDNIPRAVLNYERALRLSPSDDDIRFNLEIAQSKTIDKLTPESQMFFVTWYESLADLVSVDGWAFLSIGAMILLIGAVLLYLFTERQWTRMLGFFGGLFLLFLLFWSVFLAYKQLSAIHSHSGAVIIAPSVTIRATPDQRSSNSFVLHEGTSVKILDRNIKGWREVRSADGRTGWLRTGQIEEI